MSKLFLIIGHSGSGKSSVMRKALGNEVISFTTRQPRVGEIEGKHYYFINKESYDMLLEHNKLAEKVEYAGNFYGFSKEEIDSRLEEGNAYAIVTKDGAKQLQDIYENCVTIFLYTSDEQAVSQMKSRGDSVENIAKRMIIYQQELEDNRHWCDYVIKNINFGETVNIVKNIIRAESVGVDINDTKK